MQTTDETPKDDRWFAPQPGIYYAAMWYFVLPKRTSDFGLGWNLTAQLWRKDSEPLGWHLLFRYRHYRGEVDGIFNGTDVFRWHEWNLKDMNGAEAEAAVAHAFQMISRNAGALRKDYLPIHGGEAEFFAAVQKQKPEWIHLQAITQA